MENKQIWKVYAANLIVGVLVFVIGLYTGYSNRPWVDRVMSISNKESVTTTTTDFSSFWKAWSVINQKFPNPEKADDQTRVYGAIQGLLGSLGDPYSVFFPPTDAKLFKSQIDGSFSGIGMEVGIKDRILTVISPLKGTPAEKAGVKTGDKIIKINDVITSELSIDKAIELIRGEKGTVVKLTMFREGDKEPRVLSITRDTITIPTIDQKVLDGGIHLISLYSFDANADKLFREEIVKFKQSNDKKLIIDLRGNPGGYLDAAVDMASWFLPSGEVVVKEDYGSKQKSDTYRSRGYDLFDSSYKIAILVNGGSASASEILAGALSEHGVAKLIGTQTFGKGSVQEVVPITEDTFLKITVAKWLTPKGVSISEKGLTPDIVVKSGEDDEIGKKDAQLDRAIKYINTGK